MQALVELPPKFKTVEAWADSLYDEVRPDKLLLVPLPAPMLGMQRAVSCFAMTPQVAFWSQCLLVC